MGYVLKKQKRIGILGGTFNPPHMGHFVLAQEALKRLKLNKVVFMPVFIPPHKKVKNNKASIRCKMLTLACRTNSRFEVSRLELERKGVSYSIDTLRKLRNKYGKSAELFFIAGSDSLRNLESWKNIDKVLKLVNFVVAARPGFPVKKIKRKVKLITLPALNISSSVIRKRVRLSQSIRYLVPEDVRKFIIRRGLYK